MAKKNEKKNTGQDKNIQENKKKRTISNDDLKMSKASGDIKGPVRKETRDDTARIKKPSKINQATGGKFENKEIPNSNKEEEIKSLPKPKVALPPHNEDETLNTVQSSDEKNKGPQRKQKIKEAQNKTKPAASKSKKAKGEDPINSPGPEVKGDLGKTPPKKKSGKTNEKTKEKTSKSEDFTEMAKSKVQEIAGRFLPDEEARNQILETAKEILPDEEDIGKLVKKFRKDFSPEIEQVNKIVDQVLPQEEIKEKKEKLSTAAKQIKNKSQEKAAKKSFNELSLFTDYDIHLFKEGKHYNLHKKFGAHPRNFNGTAGVYFAVWAPNAKSVSVIGDFNDWYKQANPMTSRPDHSGIWEVFIPEAKKGSLYKYFIQSTNGYEAEKGDPFALLWEVPPNTASVVWDLKSSWNDEKWLQKRKKEAGKAKPVSVYEMHIGSWKRVPEDGMRSLTYKEMADDLPRYIKEMGFTHVEFMPVMEHPFFGSWGYQVTGYFAPSSRFGTPQEFMHLIDALHQEDIGVILDWVPSHFPSDLHGLHYFDGTFLYEHADPKKGFHPDWKSYIFNFGRNEVRSFLISNALFWLEEFHVDGLRVDAVASMLYLDYSREEGEWEPNEHGGNENLEAISFLKDFNEMVYAKYPDTMTIAEESTAWPMVSKPTYMGGLGFGMKWMMGWMHDTLTYFQNDPIHRKYHQNTITFSTNYAFTENFMLPLSHDEVVYGKQSLINKMPGDEWNKFANLRALYSYMYAHSGTKLLFMGGEFAQTSEWDHDSSLDWHLADGGYHKQLKHTVERLNEIYKSEPAFYEKSFDSNGFEWVDFHDTESSIISFLRKGNNQEDVIMVVCNLTPVPRENYRLGAPAAGNWHEIFNSDDEQFGGSNTRNTSEIETEEIAAHGKKQSVALTLPPMGVIYLKISK